MKCPFCGNEISDDAQACIHCWKDIPRSADANQMTDAPAPSSSVEAAEPPVTASPAAPGSDVSLARSAEAAPHLVPLGMSAEPYPVPSGMPESLAAIWRLSDVELTQAHHSSVVLGRLGMIFYLLPCLIAAMMYWTKMGNLRLNVCIILFYCVFFWPVGFVLRNVRSLQAQRRLKHISVFTTICGFLAIAVVAFLALQTSDVMSSDEFSRFWAGCTGILLIPIAYTVLWLYVFRHCRNPHLFSDDPCSPEEVAFIALNRPRLARGAEMTYPAHYQRSFFKAVALFGCLLSYLMAVGWVCVSYLVPREEIEAEKTMGAASSLVGFYASGRGLAAQNGMVHVLSEGGEGYYVGRHGTEGQVVSLQPPPSNFLLFSICFLLRVREPQV